MPITSRPGVIKVVIRRCTRGCNPNSNKAQGVLWVYKIKLIQA